MTKMPISNIFFKFLFPISLPFKLLYFLSFLKSSIDNDIFQLILFLPSPLSQHSYSYVT